jgi:hypothetical protein
MSVSQGFSSRRSLLDFPVSSKSTPQRKNKSPLTLHLPIQSFREKPSSFAMFRCNPLRRAAPAKWTRQLTRLIASANDLSPAILWRTRARSRTSAAACWATKCRTAATSSGGDHHVINRRMNMGDAMMNRPLIASRETVLRHRQRNSTHKERSHKR